MIGGSGRALVIAGREPSLELIAWARLGLAMQAASGSVDEVVIAAPSFDGVTRRAAQQLAAERIPVRLVSVAALAESTDGARSVEIFPASHEAPLPGSILDRVVRVVDGAVTVTGAGALRRFGSTHLVYLRGVCALSVAAEGDGAVVNFSEPESRQVHVTDANFSSWGKELHESVVQLAQDPKLIDRVEHAHDQAAVAAADAAGVRIVARWLPRGPSGLRPASWLGQNAQGVPVVGIVHTRVGVSELAEVLAGLEAAREQLSIWIPSATQAPRLLLITENLDAEARSLLDQLEIAVDTQELDTSRAAMATDAPRGRRRRQRRGGRGRDEESARAREGASAGGRESQAADEPLGAVADADVSSAGEPSESASDRPRRSRRRGRRSEGTSARQAEAPEEDAGAAEIASSEEGSAHETLSADEQEAERRARVERRRARRGRRRPDAERENESGDEVAAASATLGLASDEDSEPVTETEVVAAVEVSDEEVAAVDAPEEPPVEKPHRRRSRASICVRDDPDSILAALILSRDRRHIPFFYVCSQSDLMDFFRGKATDLEEASDLLMVGFSADPIPRETISMAELFRGRIQWFDSGNWAIEDIEALRAAIGEDCVAIEANASSPLAPVLESCERRSRFTDKLVDLSARRLSENEMERWGYRLMGLVSKMVTAKGDQRTAVSPILAGKATEIPDMSPVYAREAEWLQENDPRMVHFGEYQMAVVSVPEQLDAAEIGRRARLLTGARLSLACRENDNLIILGSNDEKRYINLTGVVDSISSDIGWARARNGGDRIGRFEVEQLGEFPERLDAVIGAISRYKSVLYG